MPTRAIAGTCLTLLGALALGCSPNDQKTPLGPLFMTAATDPMLSGAILGPDGTSSLCGSLPNPNGSVFQIRPINPAAGAFAAPVKFITCPNNLYSFNLPSGHYLLRTILPFDPAIGALPVRDIESVDIDGSDVVHPVVVHEGTALGGAATLDGAPLPDVAMTMVYDEAPGFLAADGGSDANGAWTEFFRAPYTLQNGVRYQTGGCGALGVRELEGPPASFLFPTEVSAVNCRLETAPSVQFSHTHTRLVVTPMPGDIGGQSVELADRYGIGWGVQFPIGPGQSPVHVPVSATHLFGGGLMVGIAPDRILSGISVQGQLQCGAACRDFGLDGVLHFTPETPIGRQVTWRYSDATSPEGVGLKVVQRSFDGQLPNDYVLFRFSIQNGGAATVTFYAGTFMDWDVDEDATDDVGFTDMGGTFMGVASSDEAGTNVGTLLLGAPVSGNSFWDFTDIPAPGSTADQYRALSGGLQNLSVGPGDVHYIQGVGPITLKRGRKVTLWVAVVAGENRDQLLANARAAQADIARRFEGDDDATSDGSLTVSSQAAGIPVRPFVKAGSRQ